MKYYSFTEVGTRQNNEDFLCVDERLRAYVMCDGVGGQDKGEVASQFIAEGVMENLRNSSEIPSNAETINKILNKVQTDLFAKAENINGENGMGTTLCVLLFNKDRALVAHIGDSRIYYFKKASKTAWHTYDHSWVNYLLSMGEITEEQAINHPLKNKITRAIQVTNKNEIAAADVELINQCEPGDIFLICTDGVTEAVTDAELSALIFDTKLTAQQKADKIKEACNTHSSDNNTCILLELEEEDCKEKFPVVAVVPGPANDKKSVVTDIPSNNSTTQKTVKMEKSYTKLIIGAGIGISIAGLIFFTPLGEKLKGLFAVQTETVTPAKIKTKVEKTNEASTPRLKSVTVGDTIGIRRGDTLKIKKTR